MVKQTIKEKGEGSYAVAAFLSLIITLLLHYFFISKLILHSTIHVTIGIIIFFILCAFFSAIFSRLW